MMIPAQPGLYGEQLAVLFGFITFGLFVSMAVTCRYFPPLAERAGLGFLTRTRAYRTAFKWHSLLWFAFAWFLLIHVALGLLHTEWPDPADPDFVQHLWILIFAVVVFISVILVFSNCRSFISLRRLFGGNDVIAGLYARYYRIHSFFWILLLVSLAGHLIASYLHIGFWPTTLED
jgi:hypothetical protein